VTTEHQRTGALAAVERIVNRGVEADDVLRQVVDVLSGLYPYVSLWFVEEGGLVQGPFAGEATGAERYPIAFQGTKVAELEVAASDDDRAFLERVATLVSAHAMVGWDTGGERWEP
jgi:putative methionine-R-sulfoxide reductase with GAF domain